MVYNIRKMCRNCLLIDDYEEFDSVCENCGYKGLDRSENCAENFIDIHQKNQQALHEVEVVYFRLKHEVDKFEQAWN